MDELPSKTQLDRLYVLTNKLIRLLELRGYVFDVSMLDSEQPPEDGDDRPDEGFHEEVSWPPWTASELRDILNETQNTCIPPRPVEKTSLIFVGFIKEYLALLPTACIADIATTSITPRLHRDLVRVQLEPLAYQAC
jgi:hypothetical protein